jgi:hypothetical protein
VTGTVAVTVTITVTVTYREAATLQHFAETDISTRYVTSGYCRPVPIVSLFMSVDAAVQESPFLPAVCKIASPFSCIAATVGITKRSGLALRWRFTGFSP